MNIKRKLSLAVITIGIAASGVGCAVAPPAHASAPVVSVSATPEATSSASPEISATAAATVPAAETKVDTVAAVPTAETPVAAPAAPVAGEPAAEIPEPVEEAPAAAAAAAPAAPVKAAPPVQAAPVPVQAAPAPVQAAPVQAAPAVSREVYVGLAGGQGVVDQGRGPVLFPLPAGFPPYVAEHDALGGWARFGTLSPGMTVRMSGLVTGTYTVGQIINVPKHGTTDDLRRFGAMPKVMLQTCVPGTSRMIVVGLY